MRGRPEFDAWSKRFPDSLRHLWDGIRSSAKAMVGAEGEDLAPRTDAFLYAVGNFKRQAPIHPPARGSESIAVDWEAPAAVELWGGISVTRDDAETWSSLTSIKGVGVPTASTVLAALWPTHHAILDVLTVQAAVGLLGRSGDWGGPVVNNDAHSSSPPGFNRAKWLTWPTYSWYRTGLQGIAREHRTSLQEIERALFELMKWQFRYDPAPKDQSWAEYGGRLEEILVSPPQG